MEEGNGARIHPEASGQLFKSKEKKRRGSLRKF